MGRQDKRTLRLLRRRSEKTELLQHPQKFALAPSFGYHAIREADDVDSGPSRPLAGRRENAMKKVALSEVKDDLSKYLRLAEKEEIVITRHGRPAGVLIGFASEDDWFDYRLEHDPRFLARIERARQSLRAGQGIRLEDAEL